MRTVIFGHMRKYKILTNLDFNKFSFWLAEPQQLQNQSKTFKKAVMPFACPR